MNKFIALASVFSAFVACCPPNFAQAASTLTVGQYTALAASDPTAGVSVADTRNINVGLGRAQVVHLQAQGQSQAEAFIHDASNSNWFSTPLTTAIQFTVPTGNPNRMVVVAIYTPPTGTPVISRWTTAGTALPVTGTNTLAQLGTVYSIPLGAGINSIPAGSSLNAMWFDQAANTANCNSVMSNIYQIGINGTQLGIDTTDSSTAGTSCQ